MTGTFKLYAILALVIVLGLMGWGLKNWDTNRLDQRFEDGKHAERAEWVVAQLNANERALSDGNSNTRISEGVADQARSEASTTTAASTAANQSTVKRITDAYEASPRPACGPDTGVSALPDGVLEGLREARSAALGTSAAPAGGLQPAQRPGSTVAPTGH